MTPRLRRLQADYSKLVAAFSGHPHVKVEPLGTAPPERYRVVYNVPGLHLTTDDQLVRADQHLVEIQLPSRYPREKPYCTSPSPIFHPNFGNYVCIADYWSPGQSLVDVVVQIGDMIQFKLYNTGSPLNAVAARWATQNIELVPIGTHELLPVEPEIQLGDARANT